MTRHAPFVLLAIALLIPTGIASAQAPEPTMDFTLGMQVLYGHDFPEEGDATGSFSVRRFRPGVGGSWGPFDYRVMAELAGGSARLLDGYVSHEFSPYLTLTVGQSKVPFVRQFLTSSTRLQLVGVSGSADRFNENRQPGLWVTGEASGAFGVLEYMGGLFNGEGINTPDQNSDLLHVGRLVWMPSGPYDLAESSLDRPGDVRFLVGGGILSKEETVGDEPYDLLRFALEAAIKRGGFNAVAEVFHEDADELTGPHEADTSGGYGQAAYLFPNDFEVALRYAWLDEDVLFGIEEETEIGIGVNRYLEGHGMKVQGEFLYFDREESDASEGALRIQLQLAF